LKGSFRVSGPLSLDCDALIIGSGAGGASVADVLTRAGLDVVMLEEGPHTPAQIAEPFASEALLRNWRCGGLTAALGRPPIVYAEGRGVGGGTEINSAIFQRADGKLLDEWAERYGIDDFGVDELSPFYERAERAVNVSFTASPLGAPSEILERGGERLGWKVMPLPRAQHHCVGTNACSQICPTGAKQSMSQTLLPESLKRSLRLIANCRAHRILHSGDKPTEVLAQATDYANRRHPVRVRARAIFLCAGAVHTPALLQRSGIRRNIGTSLRLHPTLRAIAMFDEEVDAAAHRLPLHAIKEFMPEQRIGGSVFTPPFYAMALAEDPQTRAHLLTRWKHAGIYYGMIRPQGKGRVTSLPGCTEPLVSYRHGTRDMAAIAEIAGRLAEFLFAAGARYVIPSISGHAGWSSVDEARRELAAGLPKDRTNLMSIHLFSSCPPGEKNALTATDSFGRVWGFPDIIVSDASQIPEAPGCNPQASVMAIAFRNAEAFLARSRKCG
jgi:choline dehydrogenase-like flavoprotein